MSSAENRLLVQRFYALMSALDFATMFTLLADDATWTIAGNPALFLHSGTATKPQRMAALAHFTQSFATLTMELRSLTAEEDRVAAELITHCTTHSGLTYENELLVLIRCRAGKIISLYEHLDQATALDFEKRLTASA